MGSSEKAEEKTRLKRKYTRRKDRETGSFEKKNKTKKEDKGKEKEAAWIGREGTTNAKQRKKKEGEGRETMIDAFF
jgi:hypothetical protein